MIKTLHLYQQEHNSGKACKMVQEQGMTSLYLRGLEIEAGAAEGKINDEWQSHLPKEEELTAAVADLCQDGARRLHNYPLWKQRFLQFLLQEYGADPDQVMTLSGIPQQFKMNLPDEEEWDWGAIQDCESRRKAKAAPDAGKGARGYRG